MKGLTIQRDGHTYVLNPNQQVIRTSDAARPVVGSWDTSVAATGSQPNHLCYTIDGQQTIVPVIFDFTPFDNQLKLTLKPADGAADTSFTYAGQIVIDDSNDIIYRLLDDDGNVTGQKIVVYGKISLASGASGLQIELTGSDHTTSIRGAMGVASFRDDDSLPNADRLVFNASTENDGTTIDADIAFVGAWVLSENGAVFSVSASGAPGSLEFELSFVAKVGIVTTGLQLTMSDENGIEGSFFVGAAISKSRSSTTWMLSLGKKGTAYSFDAAITHAATLGNPNSSLRGEVTLIGKASLTLPEGGAPMDLELALQMKWRLHHASGAPFEFGLNVTAGYEDGLPTIEIDGEFRWNGGSLVFAASFNGKEISFDIKLQAGALQLALSVIAGPGQDLTASFTVSYTWNFNNRRLEPKAPALAPS